MANKRLTQVKIDSVDVTANLLKWEIKENFGNPIYGADLEFTQNLTGLVTLAEGKTVEVWSGFGTSTDLKEFSGELISYESDGGKIKVKAYNNLYAMVRNIINAKIYDKSVVGDPINPDGKLSDAFTDLVTTYAGLTADATTVQDSGTAIFLTKFVCDQTNPKERADKLAEALNWHYFYKASDDKVYFQPKQFSVNSTILTVGSNVVRIPKWKHDKTDLINDLRLDGVFQDEAIEDLFSGDGSTVTFTLSATPVGDIAVYVSSTKNYSTASPAQTELKNLGVTSGNSGTFDYTVDKATKKITFESGSIPVSGTNNVLVQFVGTKAVPVHLVDDVSIASYGVHARTMQLTDVITVADAETRVLEVLNKFKSPFQSTTLQVKHQSGTSYSVGESIRVVDNKNSPSVDGFFTIFEVTKMYPGGFDEVKVGDRDFEPPEFFINQSERIHRLERELISEGTVLTELRPVTIEFTVQPDQLVVREEYINDSFVLNHSVNGILYDANETSIVDDFETTTNWIDTGTPTLTLSNNSTAGQFWVGTQGLKVSWTDISGTGIIENTDSQGDLQNVVGVASGTPLQGTAGVWVYMTTGSDISELRLRIGSSATDYKEYIGQTYKKKVAGTEAGFTIENGVRTYVLFDLDAPNATNGTVDWTAIDFVQFRFTITAAGSITFDYFTASKNNTIALNGLGDRSNLKAEATYTY